MCVSRHRSLFRLKFHIFSVISSSVARVERDCTKRSANMQLQTDRRIVAPSNADTVDLGTSFRFSMLIIPGGLGLSQLS
jgi:hypothetical protein